MWFLPAILSALAFGLAGFLMKYGSAKKGSVPHLLFGLYVTGTLGFLLLALYQHQTFISVHVLIAGLIVGIGSTFGNIFFMKALEYGPASLTSPLSNLNIILIVIMSIFLYGETLAIREIVAILILFISVSFLPFDPKESLSIRHKAWYGLVGLALVFSFFRNGGLKVTEELALNNTVILFWGYLFGIVWTGLIIMRDSLKKSVARQTNLSISLGLISGLIAGVFSFIGMQLYAYALSIGPASLVTPIFSLNSMVVAILSFVFFRERLSPIQIGVLITAMTGIILLRI